MANRSHIRRIAKWTGVVVCVTMAVAWAVSPRREVFFHLVRSDGSVYWVGARKGLILLGGDTDPPMLLEGTWETGFSSSRYGIRQLRWLPKVTTMGNWVLHCPLWIPFGLIAIPTAYVFYRDRRPPPGHCQECGYNLTGNTSGVCPECGESR